MKLAITGDSTMDLPKEDLEKYGISVVHFHIQQGDKSGFDNEFRNEDLFEYTIKTGVYCHTSAPNINEIEELWTKLRDEGYTHIIHVTMSSALSSAYANAVTAKGEDDTIAVIDSRGTSGALAFLARKACALRDEGKPFEEIVKECQEFTNHFQCSFLIDRLDFLYKGGRCSKLQMLGANLLRIRPTILCDKNGKFIMGKKYRGKLEKSLDGYLNDLIASHPGTHKDECYINYSSGSKELLNFVASKVKELGFKETHIYQASPTNSYHAGPNTIGLQFIFD